MASPFLQPNNISMKMLQFSAGYGGEYKCTVVGLCLLVYLCIGLQCKDQRYYVLYRGLIITRISATYNVPRIVFRFLILLLIEGRAIIVQKILSTCFLNRKLMRGPPKCLPTSNKSTLPR